jgi:hypothetical protein
MNYESLVNEDFETVTGRLGGEAYIAESAGNLRFQAGPGDQKCLGAFAAHAGLLPGQ